MRIDTHSPNPCPMCGTPCGASKRGPAKRFCGEACRRNYHRAAQTVGGTLLPYVVAAHHLRHTDDAAGIDLRKYARRELGEALRLVLAERPELLAAALALTADRMANRESVADRR